MVTVVPPNNSAHPKLRGESSLSSGSTLQLAWRMFPPTYVLQCSPDFNGTDTWVTAPWPTDYSNGWFNVSVPATNRSQFFRLRKF